MGMLQHNFTHRRLLQFLMWYACGLIAAAFVLEYGFDVLPCRMCWWQRYAHWTIEVGAVVGLAGLPRLGLLSGWIASVLGLGIAVWQTLGQLKLVELPAVCTGEAMDIANVQELMKSLEHMTPPPACDEIGFTVLGLSLAMWNIPAMLVVMGVTTYGLRRKK